MNNKQREAIDNNYTVLMENIDPAPTLQCLRANNIISTQQYDEIKALQSPDEQKMKVIEKLKTVDRGWEGLLDVLRAGKQNWLATTLEENYQPTSQMEHAATISEGLIGQKLPTCLQHSKSKPTAPSNRSAPLNNLTERLFTRPSEKPPKISIIIEPLIQFCIVRTRRMMKGLGFEDLLKSSGVTDSLCKEVKRLGHISKNKCLIAAINKFNFALNAIIRQTKLHISATSSFDNTIETYLKEGRESALAFLKQSNSDGELSMQTVALSLFHVSNLLLIDVDKSKTVNHNELETFSYIRYFFLQQTYTKYRKVAEIMQGSQGQPVAVDTEDLWAALDHVLKAILVSVRLLNISSNELQTIFQAISQTVASNPPKSYLSLTFNRGVLWSTNLRRGKWLTNMPEHMLLAVTRDHLYAAEIKSSTIEVYSIADIGSEDSQESVNMKSVLSIPRCKIDSFRVTAMCAADGMLYVVDNWSKILKFDYQGNQQKFDYQEGKEEKQTDAIQPIGGFQISGIAATEEGDLFTIQQGTSRAGYGLYFYQKHVLNGWEQVLSPGTAVCTHRAIAACRVGEKYRIFFPGLTRAEPESKSNGLQNRSLVACTFCKNQKTVDCQKVLPAGATYTRDFKMRLSINDCVLYMFLVQRDKVLRFLCDVKDIKKCEELWINVSETAFAGGRFSDVAASENVIFYSLNATDFLYK